MLLADHQAALYRIHAKRPRRLERTRYLEPVIETRRCAYGGKRSFQIWEEPAEFQTEVNAVIANPAISGTFVAYEEAFYGGSRYTPEGTEVREEWHVVVRNLRTGRVLHRVPTGVATHPMWVGDGWTTSIVLGRSGSVAWIAQIAQARQPTEYEVRGLGAAGERVLARGSTVDPHSLALAGSTLYWTQGTKPESAALN